MTDNNETLRLRHYLTDAVGLIREHLDAIEENIDNLRESDPPPDEDDACMDPRAWLRRVNEALASEVTCDGCGTKHASMFPSCAWPPSHWFTLRARMEGDEEMMYCSVACLTAGAILKAEKAGTP